MGNITSIVFDKESAKTIYKDLWQYDYGQILRIEGLNLPKAVEIHFSLQETGGEAKRRIGITDSGVTDVVIPDFILEGNKTTRDYYAYAFIYVSNEESGETTHKIKMRIISRPEPEGNTGTDDTSFGAIMEAVQKIAEGVVSDEQVQNAVNKYLDENPIEAVSDEQIAEAVFDYLQENPIEGVTDEQVASAVKAYLLEHPVTGGTISAEQIAQAVSEYMAENPIEIGATKEQAEQIEKNKQDIGKLSEQISDLKQDGTTGGGTVVSSVEPMEDDIPKVFLTGDEYGNMNASKNEVNMEMEYISKTLKFHSYILIKWQGSSSITNGYPKHNFTVKMFEDEAKETKKKLLFKDWKFEKNKYVWKANYIDVSHARNIVCARLWSEVVASRSDYDLLPEELKNSPNNGAIDGFPIKVYVNGTYDGIYTWNIGKDDWMWNMDEDNPNHLLVCAEQNVKGESPCNFNKTITSFGGAWSIEVGTSNTNLVTSFNNLINCVMNADDETFKSTIGNHLDIQSAIDYYAFHYAICGLDGLAKNMLLGTYDGVKWIVGSYDMDSTCGLFWNGSKFVSPEYACPEEYQANDSLLWRRIEKVFKDELQMRYSELRKSVLSFSNICTHFERFMDSIGTDLYNDDETLYPRGLSQTNNITQIRNFVRDRLLYVDNEISNLGKTTYMITNNLTGVRNDNVATVISEGASYNANIIVDGGNGISRVVITMGGVDVTGNVYDDGAINIPSVTGNIVITVVAQSEITDEGLVYSLPTATTFDGTNAVDTGWKLAENKSFTYAFTLDEYEVPTGADTIVCSAGGWKGVVRLETTGTLRLHGFAWTPIIPFSNDGVLKTKGVFKCVAKYNAETSEFTAKMSRDGIDISSPQWNTQKVTYNAWSTTLKLGEAIIDGANERQGFAGTISDFRVYERAFTESEINTYLGI